MLASHQACTGLPRLQRKGNQVLQRIDGVMHVVGWTD